jgi:hypothetical protein
MSDTKARPGSGKSSARKPLVELPELQVRISCGGKGAAQALEELRRGLVDAEGAGRDPLVVLEELGRLEDSVVTFIKGLSRMLVGYPRAVTFWESSGYSEAFLSVMEQPRRAAGC